MTSAIAGINPVVDLKLACGHISASRSIHLLPMRFVTHADGRTCGRRAHSVMLLGLHRSIQFEGIKFPIFVSHLAYLHLILDCSKREKIKSGIFHDIERIILKIQGSSVVYVHWQKCNTPDLACLTICDPVISWQNCSFYR